MKRYAERATEQTKVYAITTPGGKLISRMECETMEEAREYSQNHYCEGCLIEHDTEFEQTWYV